MSEDPLTGAAARRIRRRTAPAVPPDLPADMEPLLKRVFAARQVASARELEHALEHLVPFRELRGIDGAVDLLEQALARQWRILVVGDFDADGATSTALAVRALRSLGAQQVDFLVPNRFAFGYGLTPEIVAVAAERRPELIITVDNGISSLDGVVAAAARGIRVLVTDHHLAGEQLPAADAIVNPNQPGDGFPSKALAGVGVIFYVMLALRARLREAGWFAAAGIPEPNLARLLDLVALGTVADVVPLDHNNRILVAQGLARIRNGRCCPGIAALIEVAGRERSRLVSADLGFALGPRLNAAGRLDDMSVGIRCLLSEDPAEARELAAELDRLNRERRAIEGEMQTQAMEAVRRILARTGAGVPVALCLYDPGWHEGVIGILASRVKERLHRPVIVFTDSETGAVKGSARSIPGLHIRDTLDAVAARHPGLLSKFGGHAMAAGLTLERERLDDFRHAFEEEVRRRVTDEALEGVVLSDGELSADQARLDLAESLRNAVPWGQGFPEPVFDGVFEVVQRRIVGERHLKLLLQWPDGGRTVDAIAFNVEPAQRERRADRIRAAYRLDVNEYRDRRNLQLIIEYLEFL